MIKRIFYLFILLSVIHLYPIYGHSKLSQIQHIPLKDRVALKQLFKYLLWNEQALFVYTLHGSKPISFTCFPKGSHQINIEHPLKHLDTLWNTWISYRSMFPIQQYAFFAREENNCFVIYIVNKKVCLEKISEHLALFQQKLNCSEPSEMILEKIISSKNLLRDSLNNSHALLGILLGYGKENSLGFENYYFGEKQSDIETPKNLNEVKKHKKLSLPSFAVFSLEEDRVLTAQYENEREKILRIYKKGNMLEIALSELTKDISGDYSSTKRKAL